VGEVFNAAIPRPFTFPEVAAYLSEKTGESVLEATVPVRWVYWSDVRKAKSTIGYVPKGDLERVFDTALADKAGEPADVIPA
jgi:nucleoside-diphosphate-sugar epimerase